MSRLRAVLGSLSRGDRAARGGLAPVRLGHDELGRARVRRTRSARAHVARWSAATSVLLFLLAQLTARVSLAQPNGPFGAEPPAAEPNRVRSPLAVEARPIFGEASLTRGGFGEVLVRISNTGTEPEAGQVHWTSRGQLFAGGAGGSRTDAPFSVAAGATVGLRLPVRVGEHAEPRLSVSDGAGRTVFELDVQVGAENAVLLAEVSRASALGATLRGTAVGARSHPWPSMYGGGHSVGHPMGTLEVGAPAFDPSTNAPVMPERIAGYSRVAALLMRSEDLVHLGPAELEALAGYLIGGGTLALVVNRPEDLRHPVLVALLGAEAAAAPVAAVTLAELTLAAPPAPPSTWGSSPGTGGKVLPAAPVPEPGLAALLVGHAGGNLQPSAYGASAAYGLGEVHLLAFDPTTKPGVDSPWVHVRMIDLVRRATERRSSMAFGPGLMHGNAEQVRRQLDPNESARWAIIVTALLLFGYAGLAGPLNFSVWRKRGRPLRALAYLPLWSALTFVAVTGVGLAAKGCTGRSRHLTLVEAGAGMGTGSARRWRGFYVPDARKLTIQTRHASSVLSRARMDWDEPGDDRLLVDRDGTRLSDLSLRPWETVVVREDDWATLGDGVTLRAGSAGEVTVVNRTGRTLRGLLLRLPGAGGLRYLARLDDGGTVASSAFDVLLGGSVLRSTAGGLSLRWFDPASCYDRLETASSGLGDAWTALSQTADGEVDWFPEGVPVLMAQMDGGGGATTDARLIVDSDRVLLRIVGFGGRP